MSVDIVIVHFAGDVEKLLDSIGKYTNGDFRIIVIKNSSRLLSDGASAVANTYVYPMPENIGWVKAANAGLSMTTAPFVVLMNDDVEVRTDDWTGKMMRHYKERPDLGCLFPGTTNPRYPGQRVGPGLEVRFPVLPKDGDLGQAYGSFYTVMFSRESLVEVGLLDERFSPCYADDNDWVYRAALLGKPVGICGDVDVWHEGGASYGAQRSELAARNQQRLRGKYL